LEKSYELIEFFNKVIKNCLEQEWKNRKEKSWNL
jgi:hypothetical protein